MAAIQNAGFRAVLLSGSGNEKVVDPGMQRALEALVERGGNVLVGSHDRDFARQIEQPIDSDHSRAMGCFPR